MDFINTETKPKEDRQKRVDSFEKEETINNNEADFKMEKQFYTSMAMFKEQLDRTGNQLRILVDQFDSYVKTLVRIEDKIDEHFANTTPEQRIK